MYITQARLLLRSHRFTLTKHPPAFVMVDKCTPLHQIQFTGRLFTVTKKVASTDHKDTSKNAVMTEVSDSDCEPHSEDRSDCEPHSEDRSDSSSNDLNSIEDIETDSPIEKKSLSLDDWESKFSIDINPGDCASTRIRWAKSILFTIADPQVDLQKFPPFQKVISRCVFGKFL
ncbi:hypothetical protein PsorP6_010643 [Peronosclerospora sorghi]|uniref:Uncharacterized protein n=1 Tax=Peronosclerospora sorghi TaxID=230839 RepID=A0ACC0VTZ7_9STRA|nr:hypothetical protein PsorP6_010643 [Peronosclerospora sorghi]